MVGVPTALHIAAELLAVAAAAGLAVALLEGSFNAGKPGDGEARPDLIRVVGGAGGAIYAVSHILTGALIGSDIVWSSLAAIGLLLLAIGVVPQRIADLAAVDAAARPTLPAAQAPTSPLPLLVPLAAQPPSYLAAAAGIAAATRVLTAGRQAAAVGAGLALMAIGHAAAPTSATIYSVCTLLGAISIFVWLWQASRKRILTKLLTAFVATLLALAILLAGVLSAVGAAELTAEELTRLERVAAQLTAEVADWPAAAVAAAEAATIAPRPLLEPLDAIGASLLYDLAFSDQDFFLILANDGSRLNVHPPDLGGSLELTFAGDPDVTAVRTTSGDATTAGGLISAGGRVVAFGAVPLRPDDLRPEDPPAGVLVTGRIVDQVWAEQQASSQDVAVIGQIAGTVSFTTTGAAQEAEATLTALEGRPSADLSVDDQSLFVAASPLQDPGDGALLGRIAVASTREVIANVERAQAQRLFVVSLLGALLALLLSLFVTRRFVQPIATLTAAAIDVGRGDLARRAAIDSPDEVGALGATFDEMVSSLAAQQDELTTAASREARLRGRLESLTTSMGDGLIAVDASGSVITFNPAAEALTGLRGGEVVGRSLSEVLQGRVMNDPHATDPEVTRAGEGDVLGVTRPASTTQAVARLVLAGRSAGWVPVAATASPVRSPEGEVLGRVFVLRDVSREVEIERMKTEFLANVSHELRTPITPIKGYANVLARRDVGPERTAQFASEILASTHRLERIVGMIVDFAALDGGRVVLARDPIDLVALVESTLQRWRADHPDRTFVAEVAPGVPHAAADTDYLRRCVDELLDNAVKFSPDGAPIVARVSPHGPQVRLDVIDRGIGLEPEAAATLFADFVQADGTETRHFGGLGLGLALVKRILDGIGATAHVSSAPGEGTTMTLLLPAAMSYNGSSAPQIGSGGDAPASAPAPAAVPVSAAAPVPAAPAHVVVPPPVLPASTGQVPAPPL